jgi:Zn finger protein HypA/HybF involved in hydrogenase expression
MEEWERAKFLLLGGKESSVYYHCYCLHCKQVVHSSLSKEEEMKVVDSLKRQCPRCHSPRSIVVSN